MTTHPEAPVPHVPPTPDDHPDVERRPYPKPEVGNTQNDDDQSGPPADEVGGK